MNEKALKALGDPQRYRLLSLMAERSYCVGALAVKCGLSESAVSQHLKILREAGLIYGVKLGYYTHYRLCPDALRVILEEMAALLEARRQPCEGPFRGCSEAAYVRCRAYTESMNEEANKGE